MRLLRRTKNGLVLTLTAGALSTSQGVWAELKPISDDEMADITGQAMISVDGTTNTSNDLSYIRINLGMDISTKLNADKLELGRYERAGEKPGSSDILINNFGLGYIQNSKFFNNNSHMPSMLKADGSFYRDGEIAPFEIKDPYLEFARDTTTGELVGVRLGFGQAQGLMTGVIQYLSGAVDVNIRDTGSGLVAASSNGNPFDRLLTKLAPILTGPNAISSQAQLVNAQGKLDPVRAEYIGMVDGSKFTIHDVAESVVSAIAPLKPAFSSDISWTQDPNCNLGIFCAFDIHIKSKDCSMLGVTTCFPLGNFQTLPVGEIGSKNGKKVITGPASGMFLSFQTKNMPWFGSYGGGLLPTGRVDATKGAFFNIPTGAVQVNLDQSFNGTPMVRQEFINRGRGLF